MQVHIEDWSSQVRTEVRQMHASLLKELANLLCIDSQWQLTNEKLALLFGLASRCHCEVTRHGMNKSHLPQVANIQWHRCLAGWDVIVRPSTLDGSPKKLDTIELERCHRQFFGCKLTESKFAIRAHLNLHDWASIQKMRVLAGVCWNFTEQLFEKLPQDRVIDLALKQITNKNLPRFLRPSRRSWDTDAEDSAGPLDTARPHHAARVGCSIPQGLADFSPGRRFRSRLFSCFA
mmetsp:Transcript_32679/g.84714  ORF Transcript_32679/g.84714 Transcript_32679/m.84714 type:complete len:234 (-) Transcript_32679:325-1026(-)